MIRIELGAEVDGPEPTAGRRHGIFEYAAVGYPTVRGHSRQPLLDACRQIKRMGGDTRQLVGLFWPGSSTPSLTCTVEAGAALTVSERKNGNAPRFRQFEEFPTKIREAAE